MLTGPTILAVHLFKKMSRFFSGRIFVILVIVDFRLPSCSNSHDNMLTGVCYSTIRTVIGREFVRKKLSIATSFEATFGQHGNDEKCYWQLFIEVTSGGQHVDRGVFRVRRKMCDTCAWWPRTSLDCDPVVAGFAFYHMLGPVRWSVVLAGFCFFFGVRSFIACRSHVENLVVVFEDGNHH